MSEVKKHKGGKFVLVTDYNALAASVAELEKDAARYRWLRDRPGAHYTLFYMQGKNVQRYELDAAIDACLSDADGEKHG